MKGGKEGKRRRGMGFRLTVGVRRGSWNLASVSPHLWWLLFPQRNCRIADGACLMLGGGLPRCIHTVCCWLNPTLRCVLSNDEQIIAIMSLHLHPSTSTERYERNLLLYNGSHISPTLHRRPLRREKSQGRCLSNIQR